MGIVLEDLIVSFRRGRGERIDVLDIPRLEITDGRQLCVVGGSGSGKTTLLNVIAGIVAPTKGCVWHDSVDLARLSEGRRDRFRAEHVGYVYQTFNLLQGLDAVENVLLAMAFAGHRGADARARARDLLERVGLDHRMHAKPATMSVGEQQRVAIARAVANHPRIVLADEPTANLDEAGGDEVLDLLRETSGREGSILILVTHERRVFERFDDVVPIAEITR